MVNSIYNSNLNNGSYIQLNKLQIAYITTHKSITPTQYEALTNMQITALASYVEKALNLKTHRH